MNRTKRECLMQRLPAPADILALIPAQEDTTRTAVICAHGSSLMLGATPEHVLACLAEREDKALRLIRRNAARLMARRRNIILPILHGCVLAPVVVRRIPKRHGRLGYINIAYKPLLAGSGNTTDLALRSGTVIRTLWQLPTVQRLVCEGRAIHYKLLLDAQQQLRRAEEFA